MNRKSILLICGIVILLGISAVTVYSTWLKPGTEKEPLEIAQVAQTASMQEEIMLGNIAMNGQAQVINGGSNDMWIRARVEMPEIYGQEAFTLISSCITEQPEVQKGVWYLAKDGYYYYGEPVKPGEQSNPLFDKVEPLLEDHSLMPDESTVRVIAEGVQINWIQQRPENGQAAFGLFRQCSPKQDFRQVGVPA